ncbi:hypothetical protein [Baaleninema sp.]|uniref:hypothetical protein n=1 Tax=Baaleninema sp. TaxID=3101197 RepID=UPI003D0844A4
MVKTVWATVRDGKLELLESIELEEGSQVLVTVLSSDEKGFWQQASQTSLNKIWDNSEEDVYHELL